MLSNRPTRTRLYAPNGLEDAALGLVSTTVSGFAGSTVAHHLPERRSDRATLFLHGAAGSWSTWTPLMRAAADSGSALTDPVFLDLPGWGEAALDPLAGGPTIDTVCELVRAAALKLGYASWDVVGHSMGGFIAMHLAARWPDEVQSVVTVSGTTWSLVESVAHPVRNFSVLPNFIALWRIMALLSALGPAGRALVNWMQSARLLRPAVVPLFRHPFRISASVVDALAREIRPPSFLAAVDITRGYDPDAVWAGIICPVTALKGDRDALVRDSDLERLRGLLPASRTVVVADCGHFANIERPDAVLDAMQLVGALSR
ncbi:pimeloyl-ACP methyl ester carboxylesterase [Salinibacterium sp. CAN_S4]|uniref:alpha/beta fold hydrolase n=1 Tax=Salinibacterium sp. CAN_S4 TaxID=2787727 RepID=UPI0018EFB337